MKNEEAFRGSGDCRNWESIQGECGGLERGEFFHHGSGITHRLEPAGGCSINHTSINFDPHSHEIYIIPKTIIQAVNMIFRTIILKVYLCIISF